ncbi:hypothetical protein C8Q75DRAFT_737261 [Abortiporus biennis]|nr:hypothetical protein C8Q75DRAFT_737261 [Abortiporus biennis]
MTNWQDPAVIAAEGQALIKLSFAMIGIYFWEFLISFHFDWEYITRQRRFRLAMILYFLNRYIMLIVLITLTIVFSVTSKINCDPIYKFMTIGGNFAVALASANLSVRMVAVWNMNRWLAIATVLANLGLWGIICTGTQISAAWQDGAGCVITHTDNVTITALYAYSVALDLSVLVLTAYKLFTTMRHRDASHLVKILFRDGLIYFVTAFLLNVIVTTFDALDLNPIMSIIFNVPSAVFVTIAATRAVRNLQRYVAPVDIYGSNRVNASILPLSSQRSPFHKNTIISSRPNGDGVHVQMETFTVRDDQHITFAIDSDATEESENPKICGNAV